MCQTLEKLPLCGVLNYFRKGVINSIGIQHQTLPVIDKEELQVSSRPWPELKEQRQFAPFVSRDAAKSDTTCPAPSPSSRCGD